MRAFSFYSMAIGMLSGIAFASFGIADRDAAVLVLAISTGSALFSLIMSDSGSSKAAIVSLAFVVASLGAIRFMSADTGYHPLDAAVGTEISVEGVVCAEPEKKESALRFCFAPDGSDDKVLVSAGRYPEYSYGDRLRFTGVLEYPESFETYEGGPVFDYVSYLRKDGIRYLSSRPRAELVSTGNGSALVSFLIFAKSAFIGRIENVMSEPHSSLVVGILLGEKGALPDDLSDSFRRAGLTHILVLSGSNVTVVAESLVKAFSIFPRIAGLSLGAGSIALFAVMTGASATTVRASIMALVVILAKGAGRRYDVTRALVLAAVAMVAENPYILAFDIGFQLSFLATLALIFVSPLVSDRLTFVTKKFQIREVLSTSISTQIFTAPFILHSMGEISIVSLAANLLVLPVVPFSMFLGFATGAAGFVSQALSLPFAIANTLLLEYVMRVVERFGNMPFASIRMQASVVALACMYACYIVVLIVLWRRRGSSPRSPN